MRIVQVLTYISVDGAYGGPVAVAKVQCEYLARLGHDVHLVAGWDGVARPTIPGVTVHLHRARSVIPGMGFAGLASAGLWLKVARLSRDADIVHFHLARDLVQLPATRVVSSKRAIVVQAHGMIRPDRRVRARIFDRLFVRPLYRKARMHLALTKQEVFEMPTVADASVPISRIDNAVPVPEFQADWDGETVPEVIYCARLHARKRPVAFVEMAARVLADGHRAKFTLVGPDAGELASVLDTVHRLGLEEHVSYAGALAPEDVTGRLALSQVYVLPSVDEPFPMSLLEAMAVGLPSVLTNRTGLSDRLEAHHAALVTAEGSEDLARGVITLLRTQSTWAEWSESARSEIEAGFGCAQLADDLIAIYEKVQ